MNDKVWLFNPNLRNAIILSTLQNFVSPYKYLPGVLQLS